VQARLLAPLAAAAVLAGPALAGHPPTESVRLGGGITGTISYRAAGKGTAVHVQLKGAKPRASVRVLFHAGTCKRHGASFALAVQGRASASGAFDRRGRVRFHGEPVGIATVADGDHVFVVVVNGRERACVAIPGLD
jgi:hypothetical protein